MEMNLKDLPGEIIVLIFSKLPFFNLPTCRMVCKAWNKLVLSWKFDPKTSSISNLLFAQSTPCWNNLHCLDVDHKNSEAIGIGIGSGIVIGIVASFTRILTVINSCNGLLCCSLDTKMICILNPMTNEYLQLSSHSNCKENSYGFGFGFSPKTKQYKIVRHSFVSYKKGTVIEIFAFDTNSEWTHLTFLPDLMLTRHGTYLNGALYWVGFNLHSSQSSNKPIIFRFDLEDEKFQEFCSTKPGGVGFFNFLGVAHDTLYLIIIRRHPFLYQVWTAKQDSSSWIKAFEVPYSGKEPSYPFYSLQLIKVYEDGKILCLRMGPDLVLYDSKTGTTQILTHQVGIKEDFLVYQIDSFTFDSLDKILAGDG